MPLTLMSPSFRTWWLRECSPVERRSIVFMLSELRRYGLHRRDPDLFKLVQGHTLPGRSPPVLINVFVQPARISVRLGRTRTIWLGIVEVEAGPQVIEKALLVLRAWTADPSTQLVAAEQELIVLAEGEL